MRSSNLIGFRFIGTAVAACLFAGTIRLHAAEATVLDPQAPAPTDFWTDSSNSLSSPGPHLGSWTQVIKSSLLSSRNDPEATLKALRETGQDFVIAEASTSAEVDELIELLYAALGTEVKVYAAVDSWTVTCSDVVWLNRPEGESCNCQAYSDYADRQACRDDWVDAWVSAAEYLSHLSYMYPNLAGFVINDFDGLVESADEPECLIGYKLTRAHVEQIRDAVHGYGYEGNTMKFLPCGYYGNFGRVLGEGYILGVNYGVNLRPAYGTLTAEEMSVTLSVFVPDSSSAELRLFQSDTIRSCDRMSITKNIAVNGVPLWSEPMGGNQGVDYLRMPVLVQRGTNTITFTLTPEASHNGCDTIFWKIWDVRLKLDNRRLRRVFGDLQIDPSEFTASYATSPRSDSYTPACPGAGQSLSGGISNTDERCVCTAGSTCLPDDAVNGYARRRLIAAPNAPYRIDDLIDGLVAVSTLTNSPSDCDGQITPWAWYPERYAALLTAAREALNGGELYAFHWGTTIGDTLLVPEVLDEQLDIAAGAADAVGVWNYEIGPHFMLAQRGVFAWRPPLGEDETYVWTGHDYSYNGNPYSFLAYWPERQPGLNGWYQRWVSTPKLVGKTITIRIAENETTANTFAVRVANLRTGWEYYADCADISGVLEFTPFRVDPGDEIVLSFGYLGNVWNKSRKAYFDVTDDAGSVLGSGYFRFESGLDDPDREVMTNYETVRDAFLRIRAGVAP